jgi:DNA repair exonuclease SbcCD ATPase subunit
MDFAEIIARIESELKEIELQEQTNQKEQIELIQNIEQLKQEIAERIQRQSELDREALELCRRGEELREKQAKIAKIQSLSANFHDLQTEFQGHQDLLATLYSSVSAIAGFEAHLNPQDRDESREELEITIETIKAKLPQAERLYQKLVAENLEQYHTYQNMIISGLDLIWCAVGFIAFGKESYKKMSLKHHPDRQGSEQAMQLINTAWEITQDYLNSQEQLNY